MRNLFVIGLLVVLAGCSDDGAPEPSGSTSSDLPDAPIDPAASSDPAEWDLSGLPNVGAPLRTETTPGGVLVQVLTEGRGDPAPKGRAMTVRYAAYFVTGHQIERAAIPAFVPGSTRWIKGLGEGMDGARLREVRRLLIPSELTKGNLRSGKKSPGGNLVMDVEWVKLEKTDLREGIGDEAKAGSKITVHYLGKLEDGTVFDSSYKRNTPLVSTLAKGSLIDGWVLGIPGMKVGGTRKLWIPWHIAYAEQDKGNIPPYSDLTFVVELLASSSAAGYGSRVKGLRAKNDAWLGIDVGTSSVKVLIVDRDGVALASATENLQLVMDEPLQAEQDAEGWWIATCAAIQRCLADAPKARIRGVGLTGQKHALLPLDANGKPLCRAMLWADGRAHQEANEIRSIYPAAGRRAGAHALPGLLLPKWLYLSRRAPEVADRTAQLLFAKDWIRFRLTGLYATDRTEASASQLFDFRSNTWSPTLTPIFDLSPEWLPQVFAPADEAGTVDQDGAAATGIPVGTPVAAGAGDNETAALACGPGRGRRRRRHPGDLRHGRGLAPVPQHGRWTRVEPARACDGLCRDGHRALRRASARVDP